MKKMAVVSLILVLVMMLAACGGSSTGGTGGTGANPTAATGGTGDTGGETGGEAPAAEDVTIDALDTLKFDPAAITAAVGQPINITMTNGGVLQHTFVWDDEEAVAIDIMGGEEGSTSRTFDAAGSYGFHCNVPGHKEAGMVGTVTVE